MARQAVHRKEKLQGIDNLWNEIKQRKLGLKNIKLTKSRAYIPGMYRSIRNGYSFLVSSSIVSLRSKILQRCARRYLKCGVANCPFTPHAYFYTFAKCGVLSQVNRKTAQVRCSYSYYFLHFSSSGVIKYRLVIKIIVLASAREWPSAGGTRTKQLFCGDMPNRGGGARHSC